MSGYPGLSPETLIYVSEYMGYKSKRTGYAEKLHWLSVNSCLFMLVHSALTNVNKHNL